MGVVEPLPSASATASTPYAAINLAALQAAAPPPPAFVGATMPPAFVGATMPRPDGTEPPPTRIQRSEALADRPFQPPRVAPVPVRPEPGLVPSARYALLFARARWQRRRAIRTLRAEINADTGALDQVLGMLGKAARIARVDSRVLSAENAAISAAEERSRNLGREHNEVDARKVDENAKFADVETERTGKVTDGEKALQAASDELGHLEGQHRGLRDKRKELERRQRAYLKAAEDSDRQSSATQIPEARADHRRAAEQHRREAAALEPDRQEIDRRLAGLDRPITDATARLEGARAELDTAKRSLADAREGHTHRLAELDAEQKRIARDIAAAESEIQQRLVTLGTLVNLNRIEDPQFAELYERIDRLRGAITARTTEIERLNAEREAYDRGILTRGIAVLGGAFVALIALIVILRAIL
ncbi:MAG TPA: hypothetical protein VGM88_19830 [Kofleriaceae bacterium]